jgi:hypothetical protein
MNKSKLNFFEQIKYAVTKPTKYYQLTKTSGGRLTGFVFLFVLITSLFLITPVLYYMVGPNGLTDFLNHKLPDFELSNGTLQVDNRVEEKDGMYYVLIDTNIEKFTTDDVNNGYFSAILISKTNMITYQYGQTHNIEFSKLGKMHIDNGIIKVIMPFIYLAMIISVIFIYLFMVGFYFFTALCYSIVGIIVTAVSHFEIKYSRIFKTAIYGKVTTSILSSILMLLPIAIPGFITTGLFIMINCAYVVYGTLSHNSDDAQEEERPNIPQINY